MNRYYTVKEVMEMEGCGKDAVYALANILPHERRGKNNQIHFFKEDYDNYYKEKREKALQELQENQKKNKIADEKHVVYQMRKLG